MNEEFRVLDDTYLPEIGDIYKRAFGREPWNDDWSDSAQLAEYIKEVAGGHAKHNYGLFIDGKLVAAALGSIRHWWEGTNYNLEELCVDPDYQGQGIGTRFMQMIEDDVRSRGLSGIFLQTDSDKPSYKFYLKNGFGELGKHVSFYKSVKNGNGI